MNHFIEKAIKTALLLALPITFFSIYFLLQDQDAPEEFTLDHDINLQQHDSLRLARVQASIDLELDSIQRFPNRQWITSLQDDTTSDTGQGTSSDSLQPPNLPTQDKNGIIENNILKGPSARFTHTYSLAVGKSVPVSIMWASDSARLPTQLHLVTITLNDVTGEKAGFTLSDPSAVLLYSQPNYAVNDKISIEDANHNLQVSVLQVQPDSARIQLTSNLTESIVSTLKETE